MCLACRMVTTPRCPGVTLIAGYPRAGGLPGDARGAGLTVGDRRVTGFDPGLPRPSVDRRRTASSPRSLGCRRSSPAPRRALAGGIRRLQRVVPWRRIPSEIIPSWLPPVRTGRLRQVSAQVVVADILTSTRPIARPYDASSCDVSTVTPTSASPPPAATAACIIAVPPRVCTVAIVTPSSRAPATASATVLGISCHLRSRNTWIDRPASSRTSSGPSRVKRTDPTLTHRTPRSRSTSASAAEALGRSRATISSAMATLQVGDDPLGQPGIGEGPGAHADE